jgi:predicted hydrocarbon binding protein
VKGIVFNLLEEVVRVEYGEDTWDQLLDAAGTDGAYTSLGSYDDDELMRLVAAASAALGISPPEVVRWFGRKAVRLLAEKYPRFFEPHTSTRPFLLTLNNIIHPEVRKIYPGADVPVFDFDSSDEDELVLGYRSDRKLCSLAEGLIEGAADHFGETANLKHERCMANGDDKCVIRVALKVKEPAVR